MIDKKVVDLLFNFYKDDIITDCKKFKKELTTKFELNTHEVHEIFTRIVNYQIDTYGVQLGLNIGLHESYDDYKRKVEAAKHRKKSRRDKQ